MKDEAAKQKERKKAGRLQQIEKDLEKEKKLRKDTEARARKYDALLAEEVRGQGICRRDSRSIERQQKQQPSKVPIRVVWQWTRIYLSTK